MYDFRRLPELTLRGLRLGAATVTLRFFRQADGTSGCEALEQQGKLTSSANRARGFDQIGGTTLCL